MKLGGARDARERFESCPQAFETHHKRDKLLFRFGTQILPRTRSTHKVLTPPTDDILRSTQT
jgi:hypothetical protein